MFTLPSSTHLAGQDRSIMNIQNEDIAQLDVAAAGCRHAVVLQNDLVQLSG